MKPLLALLTVLFLAAPLASAAPATRPVGDVNRVLFVGEPGVRYAAFVAYLRERFPDVRATTVDAFKPADADGADVVLLDWPQQHMMDRMPQLQPKADLGPLVCPLGGRAAWDKPTVLLGDTSLTLAAAWQTKGGSGCTCLSPFLWSGDDAAWDHPVFNAPHRIDTSVRVRVPVTGGWGKTAPPDTVGDDGKVAMLPLVDDPDGAGEFRAGWATHRDYLLAADGRPEPDVEVLCGGQNSQYAGSVALWRQGNLLHFGVAQDPSQMNAAGRDLLENCVRYAARFGDDRPISDTPDRFLHNDWPRESGGLYRLARSTATGRATWPGYLGMVLTGAALSDLGGAADVTADSMARWLDANGPLLAPAADGRLEPDADLKALALGVAPADDAFLDKAIAGLDGQNGDAARRTLARFVHDGPGADAAADVWRAWVDENRPYLFFTQTGGWRWYVDPLAKRRCVPTNDLRGPARADDATSETAAVAR